MRILENAIIRLLKQKPFYGHLLLQLRRDTTTEGDRCASVTIRDGVPLLSVSDAKFDCFSLSEQEALLEHLLKHLLHLHPLRRGERNSHDWDVSCDLAINSTVSGLPAEAIYPEYYDMEPGLSAEEYYQQVVSPFSFGDMEGEGKGSADQDSRGSDAAGAGKNLHQADTIDDHDAWKEAESTPSGLAEEMVRSIVKDALLGSDGKTPEDIRSVVDALLHPAPIPWKQILRQFIATAGRTGRCSTWMREHRRFFHETPGIRKRRKLNLLVGVDVSDSTNLPELREAFAVELVNLARGRDCNITVLYANSRIQMIETFNNAAFVSSRYDGGGFTDLRPVFEYAGKMHPLPAAVIYLTDGIGPVPEQMSFPTLWVLTRDGEKPAPFGVELRLSV